MITFSEFLAEARMAPLYHGTGTKSARAIIYLNVIEAKPSHGGGKNTDGKQPPKTISLTRSMGTALSWRDWDDTGSVVFELNQQKLAQTHSIKPIEIEYMWAKQAGLEKEYKNKRSQLFEEYVTKDIKPLSNYLTAVIITDKLYSSLMKRPNYEVDPILKHPLLKVVKYSRVGRGK